MIRDGGYLEVSDQQSAGVARRLLDSGVANPRPTGCPSPRDVTIVIPVRDNPDGLIRLLRSLQSFDVVVVDDGSSVPVSVPDPARGSIGSVTVLRHRSPRGPAAARNTGMRVATTPFVAFLDSDVVPRTGWIEPLLSHFSDPAVALVAPRIVALEPQTSALARYESARSSLDLGRKESAVVAGGPVSYVPSAAVVARRDVLAELGGFDDEMHVAEDVDLCWRLLDAGWRVRYEPVARVAHDHRVRLGSWMTRRSFYGTGAARLIRRHEDKVPPLAMSPWMLGACLAATALSRVGLLGALVALAAVFTRLRRTVAALDQPTRIAAVLTAQGFVAGLWQLASAACRHYWPVTLLAVLLSRRIRRAALALAVAEGAVDWVSHRGSGGLDPVRYILFRRLDDLAYGAGLWRGAVEQRTLGPLVPRLRS
ncbi:glycosyl transferase [Rhodococcus rhodnii LMG 5362]|uniref:Glycosyl transferase n=1 Tax=Rhodococcus rhodnii LMG 5362 TaxID=1273125 RepID=R7WQB5_9NOCA|nr:glycosyl transferase [Rhodococcus rhodnii LMG 5362]